jgi:hypothetical protein
MGRASTDMGVVRPNNAGTCPVLASSFVIEVMELFAEELPARSTARSLARLRRLAARSGALRRYRRTVGETRRAGGKRRADELDAAPRRIALRAG